MAKLWKQLTSLEASIAGLAALMVLVTACTLAQVHLGTYAAVKAYIRAPLVYWSPEGSSWRVPVFPGGGLVGLLLLVNLAVFQAKRLTTWRKAGLWLSHLGLIILFIGEFICGIWQVESRMPIDTGATKNYSEDYRLSELVLIDAPDKDEDKVYALSPERLSRAGVVTDTRLPVTLNIKKFYQNAALEMAGPGLKQPYTADTGIGARVAVFEAPPVTSDNEDDQPAAFVEVLAGGRSLGTWLLSASMGAPQGFDFAGRRYQLALRSRRHYLPFSLTLKKFSHDRYPGTDIPKNFSSLLRLRHPEKNEDRDVLVYMNSPLRYGGKTFYQASFGKEDTMTVLQVVQNPGWTLPYVACTLVSLGLLLHFLIKLRYGVKAA